ncbi:acyl-CoA thioesterase I [Gammaproteobacteria bacterium]|nr:arylesterase [Gammaproteobacteria bacterium]QOJ33393.1 MAG: arylesterase [Gammaproteobacteria bacterium]CAG0944221.1 acyl-CoA thioesterase I [Gammaproteobacteria bacterium]
MLVAAWQPAQAADAARTLLVVGDSLSAGFGLEPGQGWVALLQDRLEARGYGYRVVNASTSGDTTTGGLGRLPRALKLHQPAIVIIELGGNDGLRATPVALIRDNLAAMTRMAQDAGARVILAGLQMPPNYGERYTASFAAIYPAVAKTTGAAVIGFFMKDVALDPAMMQADGIHPNAAGQSRLLDNAWPVIEREIRALSGKR